tara:strand:+ start:12023 stop:13381 length:1359 start_codon:yes stop_codon:yes gene_type:complete
VSVVAERKTYFFCGVGGSGMSALAQVLCHQGHSVLGSDRNHDRGLHAQLYDSLSSQGIILHPQDGSGVGPAIDELVVSSAVEESIPDVGNALAIGIPIRKRADILASIFNSAKGIAVGGTSGKTTVTGMIGHILIESGLSPTVVNGGGMLNTNQEPGNAICGCSTLMVIEADESDGSIALYTPTVGVVTNISLDHKPLGELRDLFGAFCGRSLTAVRNLNCRDSEVLHAEVSFGLDSPKADFNARDVKPVGDGVVFDMDGNQIRLRIPGVHNVSNAAAAIAAVSRLGIVVKDAGEALCNFRGIRRRLQLLGERSGIRVFDDFAHNPDKIKASLRVLKEKSGRLLVMFQPTGFAPTKFLKDGLIEAFTEGLDKSDILLMPQIFYAGGTASRDISSSDLIGPIADHGINAEFLPERADIGQRVVREAEPGDRVVIMGARDDSLTEFAHTILSQI